ncbi:MAG: hypothetical protein JWL83_857 [Actinomycetia bacterium]|nr:hypothetical protein [Actinomycetes bacterium]
MSARWTDGDGDGQVDVVLRRHLVRTAFAPIVTLESGLTSGFRAVTRGPIGSSLEHAHNLYAAASRRGLLAQCDELCFENAVEAATRAKLHTPLAVIVRRDASYTPSPSERDFPIVIELDASAVSEKTLIDACLRARAAGYAVALRAGRDDLPTDAGFAPDLVLVDVHRTEPGMLDAIPSTALLIAEGLDAEGDLERARSLGIDYGCGPRFGRPDLLVRSPAVFDRRGLLNIAIARHDDPTKVAG